MTTHEETLKWTPASERHPDFIEPLLICFEENNCPESIVVTQANYHKDDTVAPWYIETVDGGKTPSGCVLYWAELPKGPINE